MSKQTLILEIKGNSLDDGPGIRTVIFFKGCPLSCEWCQNPESKCTGVELCFDKKECIGCNECLDICRNNALDRSTPFFVNRELCDLCFECADNCPSEALKRVGRSMEAQEIINIVKKDIAFFKTSGGGVTLSGGEATLFMDFANTLLKAFKALEIHTLLETCGHFNLENFDKQFYPYLDTIYFDLKLFDPEEHRRHCGVSNELILRNFETLHKRSLIGGVKVLPRIPLIPDITATERNLSAFAEYLSRLDVKNVVLLPYNPLWVGKLEMVGAHGGNSANKWMSVEEINKCKSIFGDLLMV